MAPPGQVPPGLLQVLGKTAPSSPLQAPASCPCAAPFQNSTVTRHLPETLVGGPGSSPHTPCSAILPQLPLKPILILQPTA